jgi:serine/arginine repetitive matrix protein 2
MRRIKSASGRCGKVDHAHVAGRPSLEAVALLFWPCIWQALPSWPLAGLFTAFSMDTPTSSFLPTRHRVLRQTLSSFKTELDSPLSGPARLSPLATLSSPFGEDHDDFEATPRLRVKNTLPSPLSVTPTQDNLVAATPQDRLRALVRGTNTPAAANQTTQLLDVVPPSLTSGNDSDFDAPPRWNSSQASSSSIAIKNIFSNALRDTPRKAIARRNSIDAGEVSDSPRVERVVHERSRHKGKRKSLSDDEWDRSAGASQSHSMFSLWLTYFSVVNPSEDRGSSHAANIEALRSRILSSSLNNRSNGLSDSQFMSWTLPGRASDGVISVLV